MALSDATKGASMRTRFLFSTCPAITALVLIALLGEPISAQYGSLRTGAGQQLPWENSRFRLGRISVAPGQTLSAGPDRVLVYLTADPDGRMPAEAVWQPAGTGAIENRGRVPIEAIAIELKDVREGVAEGTPPEALGVYSDAEVSPLIDNSRVLVAKHRYAPNSITGPLHFHTEDMFVVYLRGGYAWPAVGGWNTYRVRRGEVDVIPANTFHLLGNAGGDPLEFLVIVPK